MIMCRFSLLILFANVSGSAAAIPFASNRPVGLTTHFQEKSSSTGAIVRLATMISHRGVEPATLFFLLIFP